MPNNYCEIRPLSARYQALLRHVCRELGLKDVCSMANVSVNCIQNALRPGRLRAAQRLSIEKVVDVYFEHHPHELQQLEEKPPGEQAADHKPTACIIEGSAQQLALFIQLASTMGLKVTY